MIKLHQAKLSDTFDVIQVLNGALEKKRSYGDDAWGDGLFTASEILPHIEAGELYIVLESGDVTGVVVLQETDENMWDIDGLDNTAFYIHKLSSLRKGLGIEMIEASVLLAKKKNKTCLRLDCNSENVPLCTYYERQGFHEVRRNSKSTTNTMYMQKDLS